MMLWLMFLLCVSRMTQKCGGGKKGFKRRSDVRFTAKVRDRGIERRITSSRSNRNINMLVILCMLIVKVELRKGVLGS